jgi:membrane protein DedA with SNARE-associated domain
MYILAEWVITNMSIYGIPMLLLVAFVGSLGIPFPITLVIMAAGASARAGLMDPWLALLACVAGAGLADHSEYLLGRLAQPWLIRRFGGHPGWCRARKTLLHQGGWAILLTRFWLTPLAPAVNLLAGGRYPYRRFLFFDLTGELLWAMLYGGLGYLFAAQWQQASQAMSAFSLLSVGVVVAVYGGLWRAPPKRSPSRRSLYRK